MLPIDKQRDEGREAYELFLDLYEGAMEKPDFQEINSLLETIQAELRMYNDDLQIIYNELPEHGGGLEANADRIVNMKQELPKLQELVQLAGRVIAGNDNFRPFWPQQQAAKKAVDQLEKFLASN